MHVAINDIQQLSWLIVTFGTVQIDYKVKHQTSVLAVRCVSHVY